MAVTNSPNMTLPVPGVGTEQGPNYAFDVNSCLTLIDAHDHSPGSGVQINPAGININATLSFNSQQATALLSASFTAQNVATPVLQALSVAPGTESPAIQDLWYTDSAGNAVQLTSNGLVNATLASLPGESYSAGTFFWKQGDGSTVPANFDIGSITIRPNVAATSFGVTLQPTNTIASAYSLTLPPDPSTAGGSNFLIMDTGGIITGGALVDNSSIQYTSHQLSIKPGGITAAMIASGVLPKVQSADITASGTFTIPANVNAIWGELVGGGGGGAGAGRNSIGGPGGNGSIPIPFTAVVSPAQVLTCTVGGGGGGGANGAGTSGSAGSIGGNSFIQRADASLIAFSAGAGGGPSTGANTSAWGSNGQQTAGGAVTAAGQGSYYAMGGATTGAAAGGGGGGGANTGGPGNPGQSSGLGSAHAQGGQGYGGGGGGGQGGSSTSGNSGGSGGNGAQGYIRIFWVAP